MKNIILSAALIIFIAVSGCSDSITSSKIVTEANKYQALTEAQFSHAGNISAIPGQIVYLDLESQGSTLTGDDTGVIGSDEINYTVSDNAIYRFQIGAAAKFTVKLTDWTGGTVFQLSNPGDTVRLNLNPGTYKLALISTSSVLKPQAVFIQPDVKTIKSGKGVKKDGIKPEELNTLLETGMCEECNLENINITNKDLSSVRFLKSNLALSYLGKVKLDSAYFYKTKLDSVTAEKCNLSYSKFDSCTASSFVINATLKGAVFNGCNFIYSSIEGYGTSGNTNAIFRNSNFLRMVFTEVNLDSTQFINVILAGSYQSVISFDNTVFKDVIFDSTDTYKVNAQNALFENVSLSRVRVTSGNFTKSKFKNCNCNKVVFVTSDLTDAYLSSCVFNGGFFEGKMNRTTLIGSDIRGAYFCKAQIQNIIAYNNTKDENTLCFPF